MELRLEIKLASVEELAVVAQALSGLQVSEGSPAPKVNRTATVKLAEETETGDDGMIEVESPFAGQQGSDPAPTTAAKVKAPTAAEKKAQDKIDKKAKEDAERADRVQRLKDQMDSQKNPATQALDNRAANLQTAAQNTSQVEPVESIVEEIKQLGDKLMAFTGVPLEAKQKLTAEIMAKVGVPTGVRPTQLQQPMLGHFRDLYRSAVNATVNPVMGGLV